MKNEGWGIKEDQIPSSSHSLHQTMGSQLLSIHLRICPSNLQIWLVAFDMTFHEVHVIARLFVSVFESRHNFALACSILIQILSFSCFVLFTNDNLLSEVLHLQ